MSRTPTMLVVDDEESLRALIANRLRRKGYEVTEAATGQDALGAIIQQEFDLALFDLRLPDIDGMECLRRAKEAQPNLEVLMLTGHGTIETAIEAMKLGAYDYLTKPANLAELEVVLGKALEKRLLANQNRGLREAIRRQQEQVAIVGGSAAIDRLLLLTERVAAADSPVLIEGESGTGKELVARAVHDGSARADGPLITVNCGALPNNLLESELFGHARGAFTGAVQAKAGLVEMADRGTLFLDEVGELPLDLQAKLLRFLETGEYRRVGETRLRRVDTRIVAATNRRLADAVALNQFREDLYYRLNVVRLEVPPLRDRASDIPMLVEHFLSRLRSDKQFAPEAMEALLAYPFPGNVRELFNIVQRAVILSPDQWVTPEDLGLPAAPGHLAVAPAAANAGGAPPDPDAILPLGEMERRHILAALQATGWHRAQAAGLLGISVRNLYRKIDQFGLLPDA